MHKKITKVPRQGKIMGRGTVWRTPKRAKRDKNSKREKPQLNRGVVTQEKKDVGQDGHGNLGQDNACSSKGRTQKRGESGKAEKRLKRKNSKHKK